MRSRIILMILVLVIAGLLVGLAPEETPVKAQNKERPEALPVRVYDISAMLLEIPQYHFAYLMDPDYQYYNPYTGGGGIFDDDDDDDERGITDAIVYFLEATVRSAEPWKSMGGMATIELYEEGGLMVVRQSAEGHKQVARVLERFEDGKTRTVMLHIQAAQLDEEFVDGQIASGEFAARTKEQKAALRKAVRATHARALLSGRSGQTLSSNSGTAASFIQAQEPVVAENAVAADPTIDYLLDGLAIRLQPTLVGEAGRLHLNYRFTLARKEAMHRAQIQAATTKGQATNPIDLPEFVCDQKGGTVVIHLNTPTIISGGTVPARLVSENEKAVGQIQLYYIVTARLLGVPEETE